jgi:hypothetical protein
VTSLARPYALRHARAYRAANIAMVEAYWSVGQLIVEEEQRGNARAEYAAFLIPTLSKRLTQEFGRGFTKTNLKYFRQFYLAFSGRDGEIGHTLCDLLSWSHYRLLMRVTKPAARAWYVREAAEQGWAAGVHARVRERVCVRRTAVSRQYRHQAFLSIWRGSERCRSAMRTR